ncbi:N-6 DNA methylase [Sorangium sp. So ce1151]|uniref:N-6 DNA methylase n=1 Tax=Sorangium sp. So ce1151 TaxID=3133332 RepID=UPI003F623F4C
MPTPRDVLLQLPRAALAALADRFGVDLPDRRKKAAIVDAMLSAPGQQLDELLRALRIDELKELCRALGLDARGRDKALLVARLLEDRSPEGAALVAVGTPRFAAVRLSPGSAARDGRLTKEQIVGCLLEAEKLLRHALGPSGQHRMTIAVLLLLKRLNDAEPSTLNIAVPAQARWATVEASFPTMDLALNRACVALEESNPALEGVLSWLDFTDERRLGDRTERLHLLHGLVRPLSGMSFRDGDLATPAVLGRAFQMFLEEVDLRDARRAGAPHPTSAVAELMAELLAPSEGMRIYDPACGYGTSLVACARYVERRGGDGRSLSLRGQEKSVEAWTLARINMLLAGLPDAQIDRGDALRDPRITADGHLVTHDRVLCVPPIGLTWWGHDVAERDRGASSRYGVPVENRIYFAYLQHMLASLDPSGVLAMLAPGGVLFDGGAEGEIRERMLQHDLFDAVVGLPANLLPATRFPAALLVMSRDRPASRKRKVLFIDASRGFQKERTSNRLRPEDVTKVVTTFRSASDVPGYARLVDVDEIGMNGFSLAVRRYVDGGAPPSDEAPVQMWRRVELRNYRSIAQASVDLAPFTVLVGPNGSGKSNFADAIVFARDVATDAATAIERRGGLAGIMRWQPAEEDDRAEVQVDVRAAPSRSALETDYLRHRFTIRAKGDGAWAFHSETIELFARGAPVLSLERTPEGLEVETEPGRRVISSESAPRLSETASAMVFARQLFDVARSTELRNVSRIRLDAEAMRKPQVATENTRLDESGSNIAVALRSLDAEGQARVLAAMQRIIPDLLRIAVEAFDRFLLLKFEQRQPRGHVARFSASEMSEGALRALGILVAAQQMTGDELLIIEEPEVAIHVGAAQLLFDVLKDASTRGSLLITTHSADLLDAAREEEILVCSYRDGVTQIGPLSSAQRDVVRQGLFSVAELMRSEPLRIEGEEPASVQL